MAGEHVEIGAEVLHVHLEVNRALTAIDQLRNLSRMGDVCERGLVLAAALVSHLRGRIGRSSACHEHGPYSDPGQRLLRSPVGQGALLSLETLSCQHAKLRAA